MAATLPTSVEFHIHQVVKAFQTSIAIKEYRKNLFLLVTTDAIKSSGIKPAKIKKVSGDTGQAADNNKPDKMLKPANWSFFKGEIFSMRKFGSLSNITATVLHNHPNLQLVIGVIGLLAAK